MCTHGVEFHGPCLAHRDPLRHGDLSLHRCGWNLSLLRFGNLNGLSGIPEQGRRVRFGHSFSDPVAPLQA